MRIFSVKLFTLPFSRDVAKKRQGKSLYSLIFSDLFIMLRKLEFFA